MNSRHTSPSQRENPLCCANDWAIGYRAALADVEYLIMHHVSGGQLLHALRSLIAQHENNPAAIERIKRRMAEAQP